MNPVILHVSECNLLGIMHHNVNVNINSPMVPECSIQSIVLTNQLLCAIRGLGFVCENKV